MRQTELDACYKEGLTTTLAVNKYYLVREFR